MPSSKRSPLPLKPDSRRAGENEYTLQPGHSSFWVTIGSVSLHVVQLEQSPHVKVAAYPKGHEAGEPLESFTVDQGGREAHHRNE